jgi:protein-S-isoprenylcysteine O-methyltransferase Ste14
VLAYIWSVFGAYWIIFAPMIGAPAISSISERPPRFQRLRLTFLAVTFALLPWTAQVIPPIWLMLVGLAWAGLGLYWVAPQNASQSGEHSFYRLLRLLVGTIVFALVFWPKTGVATLGTRFVPHHSAIVETGFVAALIGLAIAAWASVHLERYWSDKVVIQSDHRLVSRGPYACMRHPIYFGALLAIVGTAMVVGGWRALLAFLLMLINYTIKARKEDQILADRFDQEFLDYQNRAGLLLPRLRLR